MRERCTSANNVKGLRCLVSLHSLQRHRSWKNAFLVPGQMRFPGPELTWNHIDS
jgi:hypothetical protein